MKHYILALLVTVTSISNASMYVCPRQPVISAVTNNFVTSILANGTATQAQPAFSNLSGSASCAQLPALTGDITSSSCATTLATVNSNTGVCGDATHICQITLNGKGLATAASQVAATTSIGTQGQFKTLTFTTSASSTTATIYHYRIIGGGGGGGGTNGTYAAAGGGGAGAYSEGTFTGVAGSVSVTITTGAAGIAGANTGGTGGTGGTSSIAATGLTTLSASGGLGGVGSTASGTGGMGAGGAGGSTFAGTNAIALAGGSGFSGVSEVNAIAAATGGWGASSPWGQGGYGATAVVGPGTPSAYGAGGGGAIYLSGPGAAGQAGIVVVQQVTP